MSNFLHGINNRGKSATTAISTTAAAAVVVIPSANNQPRGQSPLRFESVLLPSVHGQQQQRQHRRHANGLGRSMFRSYSTLSQRISTTTTTTTTTTATSTTTALSPSDPGGGDMTTTAVELPQQLQQQHSANGFWRVQRTAAEKAKLPDRINLDRRGLTALPVIEDEPMLRLLSLQHNLINSFCVPVPLTVVDAVMPSTVSMTATTATNTTTTTTTTTTTMTVANLRAVNAGDNGAIQRPVPFLRNRSTRNLLSASNRSNAGVVSSPPASENAAPVLAQSAAIMNVKDRISRMRKANSFIGHRYQAGLVNRQRVVAKVQRPRESRVNALLRGGVSFSTESSGISDVDTPNKLHHQQPPANSTTTITTTMTPVCDSLMIRNELRQPSTSQHLDALVFLDLYDNQIEKISNLDGLPSLTVLLLGKNRIRDLSGLLGVRKTLRVLDLHGNRIASLSAPRIIGQLHELKSLNLAGNSLRQVQPDDLRGLALLRELNLKRNRIKRLAGFEDMRCLERLWLCHNDLQRVDDMAAVAMASQLREVTVENNPVSLGGDCVSFLVSYLPALQLLSQMPVTEQVRKAALAWRRNKEQSEANAGGQSNGGASMVVCQQLRRDEIIANARTNWELLRGQQQQQQQQQQQKLQQVASPAVRVSSKQPQHLKPQPPVSRKHSGSRNSHRRHPSPSTTTTTTADAQSDISDSSSTKASFSIARQKAISTRLRDLQKANVHGRVAAQRRRRSVSQDNYDGHRPDGTEPRLQPSPFGGQTDGVPALLSASSDQQLCRLPPIHDGIRHRLDGGSGDNSESSVGPNVDSSSASYVSSDNEGTEMNAENENISENGVDISSGNDNDSTLTQPISQTINSAVATSEPSSYPSSTIETKTPSKLPTHVATPPAIDESPSSTSSSAAGSSNNSTLSISSTTTTAHRIIPASAKSRNSAGPRRSLHMPLVRAQTARNSQTLNTATSPTTTGSNVGRHLSPKPATAAGGSTTPTTATGSGGQSSPTPTAAAAVPIAAVSAIAVAAASAQPPEREREQGGDYLIEICGRYLNVYGAGAVRFIDRQWNAAKAADVHTVRFSYVHFNVLAPVLVRIRQRFPNAETYVFRETSINALGQLNALADVQGMQSLVIESDGNAVCSKADWRAYAIYRLAHWGVRQINGVLVGDTESAAAQRTFDSLSALVLWSMPATVLEPLLVRLRLADDAVASPKRWLMEADASLRSVVGKEALQSHSAIGGGGGAKSGGRSSGGSHQQQALLDEQQQQVRMTHTQRGKERLCVMMVDTCNAVHKMQRLETLWPTMLMEIVRNTLLDYAQMEVYVRNRMVEVVGGGNVM